MEIYLHRYDAETMREEEAETMREEEAEPMREEVRAAAQTNVYSIENSTNL